MKNLSTLLLATPLLLTLSSCNTGNVNIEKSEASTNTTSELPVQEGIINISNSQLQNLLDKNVTLVDIRRPEEWVETGVIPGSKKLTFFTKTGAINPKLVPELKKIAPTDKPVALICRTGNRTRIAAQMIKTQLDYKTVYNVEHGITKWIADGRKTVKK